MLDAIGPPRISDNTYGLSNATDAPGNVLSYHIKRPIGPI